MRHAKWLWHQAEVTQRASDKALHEGLYMIANKLAEEAEGFRFSALYEEAMNIRRDWIGQ